MSPKRHQSGIRARRAQILLQTPAQTRHECRVTTERATERKSWKLSMCLGNVTSESGPVVRVTSKRFKMRWHYVVCRGTRDLTGNVCDPRKRRYSYTYNHGGVVCGGPFISR